MQTFTLTNGGKITTQRVGDNIEFVTYAPTGSVISTVQHSFAESVPLIRSLQCAGRAA